MIGFGVGYYLNRSISKKLKKRWQRILSSMSFTSISLSIFWALDYSMCYYFFDIPLNLDKLVVRVFIGLIVFIIFWLIIWLGGKIFEVNESNNSAYGSAYNEFNSTSRNINLYAKLLTEMKGNEEAIKAKYIQIRAKEIAAAEKNDLLVRNQASKKWFDVDVDKLNHSNRLSDMLIGFAVIATIGVLIISHSQSEGNLPVNLQEFSSCDFCDSNKNCASEFRYKGFYLHKNSVTLVLSNGDQSEFTNCHMLSGKDFSCATQNEFSIVRYDNKFNAFRNAQKLTCELK